MEQYAGFESLHGIEGETVVEFSPFGCLQGQVVFDSQQFFGLLDVVENLLVDGRDVRRAVFLLDVGVGRQHDAAVRRRRGGIVGLAVDIHQLEMDIGADCVSFAEKLLLAFSGTIVVGLRNAVYQ